MSPHTITSDGFKKRRSRRLFGVGVKDFYEDYWEKRGESGFRPRYQIFFDWIENNSKVLEIGCGDGYFGQMLKQKNIDYTGCDISKRALEIAEKRGLNTFLCEIKDKIDFPDNSFDYVVMSEFLEHIIDSEKILKETARISKNGVLVSMPNTAYWRFRIQLFFGRFPKQWVVAPQEHLRYWSVKDFKDMADSLGLKVKEIKSSNGKKILRDLWPNLFGFQVCFYLEPAG